MRDEPLSDAAISDSLRDLPGWDRDEDALVKTYTFAHFREALSFMVKVGDEAEAMDHHPEWTNVYDRVDVRLCTHHAGNKITAKDTRLAAAIEQVAARLRS